MCRCQVAEAVAAHAPAVSALLERVWFGLDASEVGRPAPARSSVLRRGRQWAPPSQRPWLLMSVLVILGALGIDVLTRGHIRRRWCCCSLPWFRCSGGGVLDAEVGPDGRADGEHIACGSPVGAAAHRRGPGGPDSRAGCGRRRQRRLAGDVPVAGLAFTLSALALGTVIGVRRAAVSWAPCGSLRRSFPACSPRTCRCCWHSEVCRCGGWWS